MTSPIYEFTQFFRILPMGKTKDSRGYGTVLSRAYRKGNQKVENLAITWIEGNPRKTGRLGIKEDEEGRLSQAALTKKGGYDESRLSACFVF